MVGKWESVGTMAFERWERRGEELWGRAYLKKDSALQVIDSMRIFAKGDQLYLQMKLSKGIDSNLIYQYGYNSDQTVAYFLNRKSNPKAISYQFMSDSTMRVTAGEGIEPGDKYFTFLYQKVTNLPQ